MESRLQERSNKLRTIHRPRPESLWGFDLAHAITTGFSDEQLESLCSPLAGGRDVRLRRRPFIQADWKTEHYSFGRLYRNWLNLPWYIPLGFSGDHGFERRLELLPHEQNTPFQYHVTFSEQRANYHRDNKEKNVILAPHPWVVYRRRVRYEIKPEASGSLIFIPHESEVARFEAYDWAEHFSRISQEPSFPTPRAICLSGSDIFFRKRHLEFRSFGLPIVTAGDQSSPYVVDRFYSLVSQFRACASSNPGSEMLYTTEMGHDFWCTDTTSSWPILKTSETYYYADGRVVPEPGSADDLVQQETVRIFGDRTSSFHDRLEFVKQFLGMNADEEQARRRLRRVTLINLIKRPHGTVSAYCRSVVAGVKLLLRYFRFKVQNRLVQG